MCVLVCVFVCARLFCANLGVLPRSVPANPKGADHASLVLKVPLNWPWFSPLHPNLQNSFKHPIGRVRGLMVHG